MSLTEPPDFARVAVVSPGTVQVPPSTESASVTPVSVTVCHELGLITVIVPVTVQPESVWPVLVAVTV